MFDSIFCLSWIPVSELIVIFLIVYTLQEIPEKSAREVSILGTNDSGNLLLLYSLDTEF